MKRNTKENLITLAEYGVSLASLYLIAYLLLAYCARLECHYYQFGSGSVSWLLQGYCFDIGDEDHRVPIDEAPYN